ncbi:calpain-2 catalytic subunit-like protein [Labeo rohita]|uniref:Calpain-2 catalytic subunit-like protein n=1 Tax=Labeo rohita TaxID=84645 RepID=A0A498N0N4_LABRO|nr:calpain-2 catalytic subunit-like protein [Labeo rohita]
MTPDALSSDTVSRWNYTQFEGDWKVGSTAGAAVTAKFKGHNNIHLGPDILLHQPNAMSNTFTYRREVGERFKLPLGEYVIIASTLKPHCNGSFILRVFTEKEAAARILCLSCPPSLSTPCQASSIRFVLGY